jgi:hypothetical protein
VICELCDVDVIYFVFTPTLDAQKKYHIIEPHTSILFAWNTREARMNLACVLLLCFLLCIVNTFATMPYDVVFYDRQGRKVQDEPTKDGEEVPLRNHYRKIMANAMREKTDLARARSFVGDMQDHPETEKLIPMFGTILLGLEGEKLIKFIKEFTVPGVDRVEFVEKEDNTNVFKELNEAMEKLDETVAFFGPIKKFDPQTEPTYEIGRTLNHQLELVTGMRRQSHELSITMGRLNRDQRASPQAIKDLDVAVRELNGMFAQMKNIKQRMDDMYDHVQRKYAKLERDLDCQ